MFANSQGPIPGIDFAFPDVCLTPMPAPVPIPYPNFGFSPIAIAFYPKVLWMGMPAHNMGTMIPLTVGDQPGVATGVASGTVMGPSRHLTAAFTVLVGGLPATRLTSISLQNSTNMVGARIVPTQFKVVLLAP